MALASEICLFLEEVAPIRLAAEWDNVGLLIGRSDRVVRRLMTCLTLTNRVAEEAIRRDVQFIVTHHPLLFKALGKITDQTAEGRVLLNLIESGIAVYSPHTAFDSSVEGINQSLAEGLGLSEIQPLRLLDEEACSGSGRWGVFPQPILRDVFLKRLANSVGAKYLEVCWNGPEIVEKVAVACGSAVEFLKDAVASGCDTFVTGESRFHSVLECQSNRINLVLTGHYCSERPAVEQLAAKLGQAFVGIECFPSDEDKNPLKLYCSDFQNSEAESRFLAENGPEKGAQH